MAPPIRTRPSFPLSLSQQEASISLLSFSIRGQKEWKPQSQKTNQTDHMEHSLSNSMKLWAMPCRATQGGWVIVESSDKTWSTGEGNGKPLQYSCLENPMNSLKRERLHKAEQNIKNMGHSVYTCIYLIYTTHWKRPWCWERLMAGGKGDDRGWDDWIASLTQWTRIWANSGRWWKTGKFG